MIQVKETVGVVSKPNTEAHPKENKLPNPAEGLEAQSSRVVQERESAVRIASGS